MQAVKCLLDTGAGLNLIDQAVVPFHCSNRIKQSNAPCLRTASREPSHRRYYTSSHPPWKCKSTSLVRHRPKFSHQYAFWIIIFDCFIRGIFPAESEVVPLHSYHVAIQATKLLCQENISSVSPITILTSNTSTHLNNTETYSLRVTRQILLRPLSDHRILVITIASDINTVRPGVFEGTRQMTPPHTTYLMCYYRTCSTSW